MKQSDQLNEEFLPLWFQLPLRFYRSLKSVADKAGVSMPQLLEEAVRLFAKLNAIAEEAGMTRTQCLAEAGKLIRNRKRPLPVRREKPLVAYRWEKASAEQRSRVGRELARQRWGKRDANPENPA